jgi:hypothetical protein
MSEHEAVAQDVRTDQVTARSVAEHLNSLLISADSTAQRIVQEAEARAHQQLAEVEERVRQMEAEAARLAAWRRDTEQMVAALSAAMEGLAAQVQEVPGRIDQALAPLADHMPVVVRQIEELRTAVGIQPADHHPAPPNPAPAEPSPDGAVEVGWLPGWEDLEQDSR